MQHHHAPLGRRLEILHHALPVQVDTLRVKVPVVAPLDPLVGEDVAVVAPRRVAQVHGRAFRQKAGDKGGADAQRAGPRERLQGGDAPRGHGRVPFAEQELGGGAAEGVEPLDGEVLLVALGVEDEVLGCWFVLIWFVLVWGRRASS